MKFLLLTIFAPIFVFTASIPSAKDTLTPAERCADIVGTYQDVDQVVSTCLISNVTGLDYFYFEVKGDLGELLTYGAAKQACATYGSHANGQPVRLADYETVEELAFLKANFKLSDHWLSYRLDSSSGSNFFDALQKKGWIWDEWGKEIPQSTWLDGTTCFIFPSCLYFENDDGTITFDNCVAGHQSLCKLQSP